MTKNANQKLDTTNNKQADYKKSPVVMAIEAKKDLKEIKSLLNNNALPEFTNLPRQIDDKNSALLHWAAACNNIDAARMLIEEYHINIEDTFGPDKLTAMHYAAYKGNTEMIEFLVEKKH